jgi:hypothetical protein
MSKKSLVVPLALLAMAALLAAAFAADCVRLAAEARERVALADAELAKHERRLAKLLGDSPRVTPEVRAAIAAHESAAEMPARHAAYERLVTSFRQTMPADADPNNPLERKFMDDVAGAINRREIAEKPFETESTAYQSFLQSRLGRVARWFSAQARADFEPER